MNPFQSLVWAGIAVDAILTGVAVLSIVIAYRSLTR